MDKKISEQYENEAVMGKVCSQIKWARTLLWSFIQYLLSRFIPISSEKDIFQMDESKEPEKIYGLAAIHGVCYKTPATCSQGLFSFMVNIFR